MEDSANEVSQDTTDDTVSKLPGRLERVRILDIRENVTALRPIDRTNPQYIELLNSVKRDGVIETITVRECTDPITQAKYYGLVNGLQRFTAAKDAGYDDIDVKVIVASDLEVLMKQIILNARRVDTKPADYSEQLKRILNMNPAMTLKELAQSVSASEQFVMDRLSLLKLNNDVVKFVNEGTISLTNAYALAKLPPEEQLAFKDRAITCTPQEFIPQTTKRVKELNEAKRKSLDAPPEKFEASPHMRKLDELKAEFYKPTTGSIICDKENITDAVAGFAAGIAWVLNMDKNSIQQQIAKNEAREKEQAEAKKRKAAEREKRATEAVVGKVLGVAVVA